MSHVSGVVANTAETVPLGRIWRGNSVSFLAATLIFAFSGYSARAATYTASNETELRNAITAANADPDPSSTITLTGDIAMAGTSAFPAATKPVTINTNGHAISGFDLGNPGGTNSNPGGSISFTGVTFVNSGALVGGDAEQSPSISSGAGGAGLNLTNGTLTNDGTITGGMGGENLSGSGPSGRGGVGAILTGGTHINNGTISGGSGGLNNTGGGGNNTIGGSGLQLTDGTLVNHGTIRAADGLRNVSDAAMQPGGTTTLTNFGTIKGGDVQGGTILGSAGLNNAINALPGGTHTIYNYGTIQGGTGTSSGGAGIYGAPFGAASNLTIVNAGKILTGATNAIVFQAGAANLTRVLELQPGSEIQGLVLANAASTTDVLRLGGSGSDTFDVSAIGSTAQYRNFNVFEKTGTSTWTLTGATTTLTPWQLLGGTLSVSSDGALGDASGGLTFNGGVLQVTGTSFTSTARTLTWGASGGGFDIADAGNTFTVGQALTGSGSLAKLGAGALVLTGTNTYAGGTTVSGGTLEIRNASALGAGGVSLAGGHLRSNIAGAATLPNEISVAANRTSTLSAAAGQTLAVDLAFVGDGATVRLGTAANTGTIVTTGAAIETGTTVGLEVNGGTARAGGFQLIGLLESANTATIARDATLDLTTYDAVIQNLQGEGRLNGDGGTIQIVEGSFGGAITGTASLEKISPAVLTLTGTSTYTGLTTVRDGALVVNGSLTASPVTVAGGRLSGTGTVGGLAVQSNGSVAPGNSIGTLNVAGNVSFGAGSIYQVEVNAAGQSDRINATGTGTLSGGTVQVLAETGTYQPSTTYTILTANGGVSGTFAKVTSNFAFLDPALRYDANNVFLTLARKTEPTDPTDPTDPPDPTDPVDPPPLAFHSVAVSKNQYRTADAVEALGSGSRLFDVVIGQSVAGARQAFDALSGEAHASAAAVAFEDGRLVREAILTRLRQPLGASLPSFVQGSYSAVYAADLPGAAPQPVPVSPSFDPRRFALWGEGFGSWGKVDGNGNAASLDTATGGFILGADVLVSEAVRLGVAGGFTRTTFDVDGRLSSGSNDSVFGALYGSSSWGALSLRLGASYAWHDFDVQRRVQFPGFADSTHASYDGWTAQAFAELGYRFDLGRVALEPFAGASVLRLHTDAFQEEGGAAALTGYAQDQDLATTTLGVRAEARISESLPLTLRGLLGWRHAFGDVEPQALLAFAGGASAFTVAGVPIDRDALVAEAGLDWQASDALSLGVSYSGQIGERAQDHALKGNLTWRFGSY